MAKVRMTIEDNEDGTISVSLEAEENFPASSSYWSSAQQAAMWAYHALGTPSQDLATTDVEGEG